MFLLPNSVPCFLTLMDNTCLPTHSQMGPSNPYPSSRAFCRHAVAARPGPRRSARAPASASRSHHALRVLATRSAYVCACAPRAGALACQTRASRCAMFGRLRTTLAPSVSWRHARLRRPLLDASTRSPPMVFADKTAAARPVQSVGPRAQNKRCINALWKQKSSAPCAYSLIQAQSYPVRFGGVLFSFRSSSGVPRASSTVLTV